MPEPYFDTSLEGDICATCGTNKNDKGGPNPAGFCENGHDDWLQWEDPSAYFTEASRKLRVSVGDIVSAMLHRESVTPGDIK